MAVTHPGYAANVLPTGRLFMMLLFIASLSFLVVQARKVIGPCTAVVLATATPFFLPFIIDLYNIEPDAYLIPAFALWTGISLPLLSGERVTYQRVALLAVLLVPMLMIKSTPLLLAVVLPLSVLFGNDRVRLRWRIKFSIACFLILSLAYPVASIVNNSLWTHPRTIGDSSDVVSDTKIWAALWGAAGDYDAENPHGFVRSGSKRDDILKEVLGRKGVSSRIRHSAVASEVLYKPGVLGALREQPQYFLSTANVRFWRHGLAMFSYPRQGHRRWEPWSDRDADIDYIRRGVMWKSAPLVTVVRFFQQEWSRSLELLSIGAALLGASLLRVGTMRVCFFGLILGKILAMSFVHVLVRYTNFLNWVALISLAALCSAMFVLLRSTSMETEV